MGIGLTAQNFKSNRLPGWDKQSYGYHGDDGNSFSSSGNGKTYGPTFTTDDIIGCGVNLVTNTCFYTKNGHNLGIAFSDLPVIHFVYAEVLPSTTCFLYVAMQTENSTFVEVMIVLTGFCFKIDLVAIHRHIACLFRSNH